MPTVCVPVTADGQVDPRWGRAGRVVVARVDEAGEVASWEEIDVGWDRAHDARGEGGHHADVARFLQARSVDTVVANHMGEPMRHMLERMGVDIHLGASGGARAAVAEALAAAAGGGAAGGPGA